MLKSKMAASEFFFVPNLSDASPRVAAEALLHGTPVIMNRHIAGGWKYINDQTGVLFDGADDFLPAIDRLRALQAAGKLRPRQWFMYVNTPMSCKCTSCNRRIYGSY
jgi:glycosyltransferase involved in cell wall biosynthesis